MHIGTKYLNWELTISSDCAFFHLDNICSVPPVCMDFLKEKESDRVKRHPTEITHWDLGSNGIEKRDRRRRRRRRRIRRRRRRRRRRRKGI